MPEWVSGTVPPKNSTISLEVNFLGSCHPAKKHPNSGVPYKNEKEVYINDMTNTKKSIYMTFSGPNMLDVGNLTIKSITKIGKKVLPEILEDLKESNKAEHVEVTVKGHSRGALCAKEVYGYLKNIYRNDEVIKINRLSLFDPYAGPINRFNSLYKDIEFSDINSDSTNNHKNSNKNTKDPNTKLGVVYSLSEKRFKSPPNINNADVIIFTDVEHDKTKYVGRIIPKLLNGVYVFLGTQKELRAITIKLKTASNSREVDEIYKKIDNYVKKYTKPLDAKICKLVLELFSKIGSSKREYIFYKTVMGIEGCEEAVTEYLSKYKKTNLIKKLGIKPSINHASKPFTKTSVKSSSEAPFKPLPGITSETSIKLPFKPIPKTPSTPVSKTSLKSPSVPASETSAHNEHASRKNSHLRNLRRKNPPITRGVTTR